MEFSEDLLLERLAGMVRFPTVSNGDTDKMDFDTFRAFHRYLEETYPLLHATLEKRIIGEAALLYRWKAADSGSANDSGSASDPGAQPARRLPLLLAAHQDVVPEGDLKNWKYPPYAGVIENGILYGRGCGDCKALIMAQMEAVEALIREGFTPKTDIYLAYGYNEEVGGSGVNSASLICKTLAEEGVRLGCVLDEGGGIGPDSASGIDRDVAYIFTGEKGFADVVFTITDKGGHSMSPGKRSIIAELGELAIKLHSEPYPFRASPALLAEYRAKAPYMQDRKAAEAFLHMDTDMKPVLPYLEEDPGLASKFHTTQALTMLSASERSNILPSRVTLTMNCRLQEGDTVEALLAKCRRIAGDGVQVELSTGREHTPVSRTDSEAFRCLSDAIHKISPEAVIVPAVLGGGTDARQYYPICDSVYRFSGFPSDNGGGAHGANEFIKKEGISQAPRFFCEMIKTYA